MEHNCTTCCHLDKSRKRQYGQAYQYGCNCKNKKWGGYIPCWIIKDSLLENLNCGRWWMPNVKDIHQVTLDEWLGV